MSDKIKDSNKQNFDKYFKKLFPFIFIPILLIFLFSDSYITNNPFAELEDYGSFLFVCLLSLVTSIAVSAFLVILIWAFTKKVN